MPTPSTSHPVSYRIPFHGEDDEDGDENEGQERPGGGVYEMRHAKMLPQQRNAMQCNATMKQTYPEIKDMGKSIDY